LSQLQLRKGVVSADDMKNSFSLFGGTYANELLACQRYYQKSYNVDTPPGTVTNSGSVQIQRVVSTTADYFGVRYTVPMRANAAVTSYSPSTGAPNVLRQESTNTDIAAVLSQASELGFTLSGSVLAGSPYKFHWTAESEP